MPPNHAEAIDSVGSANLLGLFREARATKARARTRLAFRLAQCEVSDFADGTLNTPIAPVSQEAIQELGNPLGDLLTGECCAELPAVGKEIGAHFRAR